LVKRAEAARTVLGLVDYLSFGPHDKPTTEEVESAAERIKSGETPIPAKMVWAQLDRDEATLTRARLRVAPIAAEARTVRHHVDRGLSVRRAAVSTGNMAEGRWEAYSRHVRLFANWLGEERDCGIVTAPKLEEWWAYLAGLVAERRYSTSYAKTIFMT